MNSKINTANSIINKPNQSSGSFQFPYKYANVYLINSFKFFCVLLFYPNEIVQERLEVDAIQRIITQSTVQIHLKEVLLNYLRLFIYRQVILLRPTAFSIANLLQFGFLGHFGNEMSLIFLLVSISLDRFYNFTNIAKDLFPRLIIF